MNDLPTFSKEDVNTTQRVLTTIFQYGLTNEMATIELKKMPEFEKIVESCLKICSLQPKKKLKRKREDTPKLLQCYICRQETVKDKSDMCNSCRNINTIKRSIRANLNGKVSIVTGGRVKIGFETAIRLLECGSKVIITTRFPVDALTRYKANVGYTDFANNLTIYGVDLRYMSDIDKFVDFVCANFDRLDILIHNAAQTLRRPKEFFKHLLQNELNCSSYKLICDKSSSCLTQVNQSDQQIVLDSHPVQLMQKVFGALNNSENPALFPTGQYDKNSEQIDLRKENTWTAKLGEIEMGECAELLSINALAPFHMNQRFKNLMTKSSGSYIVNVSSMEGVFNMQGKTSNHPHTNMAKCALNMMTRTSAYAYAKNNIYMVSVDTGWVTNEYPVGCYGNNNDNPKKKHTIDVPLDNLDGACRILDPVFKYFNGERPTYGVFLKDYVVSDW